MMSMTENKVLQPFSMKIIPLTKLALINFEKDPDSIYSGLELQWYDSLETGKGFRLIAYRLDEYVDVYDDTTLIPHQGGGFEVCGKGLKHYRHTPFKNPCFELIDGKLKLAFSLNDHKGRKIEVSIEEHNDRPSKPMDLIAPIGVSSENPVCLPVFAMYRFDLVRKKNTSITVMIDGKPRIPDPFPMPFPKDGQMRYFARYGYDCELIDFGTATTNTLPLLECVNDQARNNNLVATYTWNSDQHLMKSLSFYHSKHFFALCFEEGFPDLLRMVNGVISGPFKIQMDQSMGSISGKYTVIKQNDKIDITLVPSDGWVTKGNCLLTKIMFQKKSIFRCWPKTYEYTQHIDLTSFTSTSSWKHLKE